jgi:hypothetical protein
VNMLRGLPDVDVIHMPEDDRQHGQQRLASMRSLGAARTGSKSGPWQLGSTAQTRDHHDHGSRQRLNILLFFKV